MLTKNLKANINVSIGSQSNETSLIQLNIYNSDSKTQQLSQEISGCTGVQPTNEQIWIYVKGQNAGDLKSKAEELGLFGSPMTYAAGSGAWALIDLNAIRENGIPIPPINEIPFIAEGIPGNSHIELKLSSSTNFSLATQLQEQEGYAAIAAFFQNFNFNLNVNGDPATMEKILTLLAQVIGEQKSSTLKFLCALTTEVSVNFAFSSWKDLSPEFHENLKSPSLKKIIKPEIAGVMAGVGDLFEDEFRLIFMVSPSCHAEIKIKAPGILSWVMSCMD